MASWFCFTGERPKKDDFKIKVKKPKKKKKCKVIIIKVGRLN